MDDILRWEHLSASQKRDVVKWYGKYLQPWEIEHGFYMLRETDDSEIEVCLVEMAKIH